MSPRTAEVVALGPSPLAHLPAAPLLGAIDEHCRQRGVSRWRLLSDSAQHLCRLAEARGTCTVQLAARLCEAISRDPREVYGPAWQEPRRAPSHRRRTPEPSPGDLPSAPLLEAVARWLRRGWSLEGLLGPEGAAAHRRAAASGRVSLASVEQVCDRLACHPYELYGVVYDRAAFEGTEPGYDPWEGAA
jgi:hypothetical protein